jgi:putative flippase GtrA
MSVVAARFRSLDRVSRFILSGSGRPVRFGLVGALTFGVQIGLLLLFELAGIDTIVAYAMALALAVQFSLVVNQLLVWQDRPLTMTPSQVARRWATFHSSIALSLGMNLAAFIVFERFLPEILAAVAGLGASTIVKFFSLDRLAFRPSSHP